MYEDNYKNPVSTASKELERFLQLIADEALDLYAMGGTAMVLKGIKESTRDIDFLSDADYSTIKKIFKSAGLDEKSSSQLCNIWMLGKVRIDVFYHSYILGTELPPNWKEKSELIRTMGKLRLFILNWEDIIITKIARSEPRDIEDCRDIVKKLDIDVAALEKRFYSIAEVSLIADFDYKFKHFKRNL